MVVVVVVGDGKAEGEGMGRRCGGGSREAMVRSSADGEVGRRRGLVMAAQGAVVARQGGAATGHQWLGRGSRVWRGKG